ncbi:MFS transporter [Lentilactobacillus kisonensis]|nr:MFS transporter [Lentilactobacillus kisonensis]
MIKGEESINLFNRIRDRYLEPATGITGLFVISSFIFLVSWGEVNPFLPLFIQNELHANATITNWVMSLCVVLPYLVGLLLAPFWARLADKHGAKPWLLRSGWGSVLVLLLMSIVQNPYELVILKLLQGLFVGFISIANSVLIQLSPRAKIGQTVGLMGTVTSLAMIAAPLIGGFLIPLMSFRLTLVFSAAILLIICIILQRRLPNTKRHRSSTVQAKHRFHYHWCSSSSLHY